MRAGPGGGSGEITVTWRAVDGASGYRVERADAPNGPFALGADLDVARGPIARAAGVTNVFASGADAFTYVEVSTGLTNAGVERFFRVVAYNTTGAAAPSVVVCGSPPGAPAC